MLIMCNVHLLCNHFLFIKHTIKRSVVCLAQPCATTWRFSVAFPSAEPFPPTMIKRENQPLHLVAKVVSFQNSWKWKDSWCSAGLVAGWRDWPRWPNGFKRCNLVFSFFLSKTNTIPFLTIKKGKHPSAGNLHQRIWKDAQSVYRNVGGKKYRQGHN